MAETAPACPALPKKLGSLSDVLKERMPDSPEAMNSARSASRRFSLRGMTNKLMSKVIGGSSDDAASWDASKLPASFFDLECADSKGNPFPLQEIRGNVVLCVNVASFWGKTATWYKELQELHSELHPRGLKILAFPCNQFLSQEPQGAEKIEACVRAKYSLGFHLLEKVEVNGAQTHPVWQWLRMCATPDASAIKWNFNMFLVGRDGVSCTRYANSRVPSSIAGDIEALLKAEADGPSPIIASDAADKDDEAPLE
jgi:glutathione peroxidase